MTDPRTPQCPKRFFISHGPDGARVAAELATYLRGECGASAIRASSEVSAGIEWNHAVFSALSAAEGVVLLIGSEPSEMERFEWSAALQAYWQGKDKRIVPILLGAASDPPFLRGLSAVRVDPA